MCRCTQQKSALTTVTTSSQVLALNDLVKFAINRIHTGLAIAHTEGTPNVTLRKGLYLVSLHLNFTPTGAGDVTFTLLNKGAEILGENVVATTASGDTYTASLTTLVVVDPSCCLVDNNAILQVQAKAPCTVLNASLSVVKQA